MRSRSGGGGRGVSLQPDRELNLETELARWCAVLMRHGHPYSEVREYPLPAICYLVSNLLGLPNDTGVELDPVVERPVSDFIRSLSHD